MASIILDKVGVEFVLYDSSARSLKKLAFNTAVGGLIGRTRDHGKTTIRALQDVSLTFEHGDRVGLIGPNGAGKTTLLRVLAGIYHPTSGRVQVDGSRVPLFDLALGMDEEATGRETILLRGLQMGLTRKEIEKRTEDIANFSGLGNFLELPVRTYSSGMTLRLLFSIAATAEADILLLDEWISVGDAEFRERANLRLHDTINRSKILVFASHDYNVLRQICNRAILIESGTVTATGSVEEVLGAYHAHRQRDGLAP